MLQHFEGLDRTWRGLCWVLFRSYDRSMMARCAALQPASLRVWIASRQGCARYRVVPIIDDNRFLGIVCLISETCPLHEFLWVKSKRMLLNASTGKQEGSKGEGHDRGMEESDTMKKDRLLEGMQKR
jgi:hypothetical protein